MVATASLYPFQREGAAWLALHHVALLADDMGLGKTLQAISAADMIEARRIFLACPAIARDLWAREITTWQQLDRAVHIIQSAADAQRMIRGGDGVFITSYALLPKVMAELRAGPRFDLCIYDEAQALKNAGAERTNAVFSKIGGLINHSARHWLLSGTPMPNHPGEIWEAAYCLFKHKLKRDEFIDRYCVSRTTKFGEQITGANIDRLPELAGFLAPHMLQRHQDDVLPDLPPLRWGHIPVSPGEVPPQPELGIDLAELIDSLARGGALSMDEQIHLETLRRWAGVVKIPAVVDLIHGELEGVEKLVVFAVHREVIAGIAAGLGPQLTAVIDGSTIRHTRQQRIDAFQHDTQPRVLILQIHAAGTAITLHRTNRVLFAETSWTPADLVQAAKRCHRIGQTRSVLASTISLAGSIDEQIAAILTRKARELSQLETLIRQENAFV